MKKISVIIPTYNAERFLKNTLDSVVSQKGNFRLEIIVCDDGSTDNTLKIAELYNCKILTTTINSGGPNKGRNLGISNATGDYIAFLDQDDQWQPDKLNSQLTIAADVVYSQYVGNETKPSPNLYQTLLKRDKNYGWAYISSLLIKNENIPLFEEYFGQLDYDWLLRLTKDRHCVQTPPLVIRNLTGTNLSLNPDYRKRDFYMGLLLVDGNIPVMKNWYSSRARYHYVMGEGKMARFYFLRGTVNWKTILYYFTARAPKIRQWIINKFKVFG